MRLRTRDSIVDWTEERGRSLTSRHAWERERSARVKGLVEAEGVDSAAARALRAWRMTESGLSLDLKGIESESGSAGRRRFFLSAILWRVNDLLNLGGLETCLA